MISTRILALATLLAAAAPASAQCLRWEHKFELSTVDDAIYCFQVWDDGSGSALYAGGNFASAGGVVGNGLARWNGHAWSTLGSGVSDTTGAVACVRAFAVFDDGSGEALYIAGQFTSVDGVAAQGVARWNGTSWSACGASPQGNAALAVFDDGSGPALYAGGLSLERWNGSTWSTVGTPPSGEIVSMCVHDDGSGAQLYVARTDTPLVTYGSISRWDGSAWTFAVSSLVGTLNSIVSFDDGSGPALYAGGKGLILGGQSMTVGRWVGGAWLSTGMASGEVHRLAIGNSGGGDRLYALGVLPFFAGNSNGIKFWSPQGWVTPSSGLAQIDHGGDVATFDSGAGPVLYAGGSFQTTWIPARPLGGIALWVAGDWQPLGSSGTNFGTTGAVSSLAAYDDGTGERLFAAGDFQVLGPNRWISPVPARWNGSGWSNAGTVALIPAVLEVLDTPSGPQLYAGHRYLEHWVVAHWTVAAMPEKDDEILALASCDFGSGPQVYAGGLFTDHVSTVAGSAWQALGSGVDGAVRALASYGTGPSTRLYAGGDFGNAGGVASPALATWDGASWAAVGANGAVHALRKLDLGSGARLFAGGAFTTIAGVAANGIASFDGTSWSALGGGLPGLVECVQSFDDGLGPVLYAGGSFTLLGQEAHVARWNGTTWEPLGVGVDGPVHSLAVYDDGNGPSLYAGGLFAHAGGFLSRNIAQWRGCSAPLEVLCAGDGSLRPCPCANTGYIGRGCDNSAGTGGAGLLATGASSPDTIQFQADGVLTSALTLFLQGDRILFGGANFGDGVRCIGGSVKRLYAKSASLGFAYAPEGNDPSVRARSATLGDAIAPGTARYYQAWYRDPVAGYCPQPQGQNWNITNGVRVVW